MSTRSFRLSLLAEGLAVCRLPLDSDLQIWFLGDPFFAMLRSGNELTIVCAQEKVPAEVQREPGWRALKIDGVFAFNETGVLESILKPLAQANIGIFALSSFDTDYVLVKSEDVEKASRALEGAGHTIVIR